MEVGPRVADVYAGRSVLVTGATGFLGKVLIEKLLFSVTGIKNVYLLIRAKNGLGPKQRMEKILEVSLHAIAFQSQIQIFISAEGNTPYSTQYKRNTK